MKTKGMTKKPLSKFQKILLGIVFALGLCALLFLAYYHNPYQWIRSTYTSDEPMSDAEIQVGIAALKARGVTEWRVDEDNRTIRIRLKDQEKPPPPLDYAYFIDELQLDVPKKIAKSRRAHTGYAFLFGAAGRDVETIQIDAVALNDKGTCQSSPMLQNGGRWNFSKEEGARYRFEVRVTKGLISGRGIDCVNIEMPPFEEMKS